MKDGAFPDLLTVEIVNHLQSDDGLDPKFDNPLGWKAEQSKVEVESSDAPAFEYQSGKLGASDDEASFAERRKADMVAAEKEKTAAAQTPILPSEAVSEVESEPAAAPPPPEEAAEPSRVGPYLGSIVEETKRLLRKMGRGDSTAEAEQLLKMEPSELSTARRRKLFLAQLAKGKSPDVVKNPWDYRRRSWLQR